MISDPKLYLKKAIAELGLERFFETLAQSCNEIADQCQGPEPEQTRVRAEWKLIGENAASLASSSLAGRIGLPFVLTDDGRVAVAKLPSGGSPIWRL